MKTVVKMLLLASFPFAIACNKDDDDNNNNGNGNNNNPLNQMDRDFMMKATYGNNAEVDAGNLANSKGMNGDIRDFGQMMVIDHQKAQTDLQQVAGETGVALPQGIDAEHQVIKQQLEAATGRRFDSLYIHMQVADHQKNIALFENEAMSGSHTKVKDYANKYLPSLRMHLKKADSIANMY